MKYFEKRLIESGYGIEGFVLKHIFSISKTENNEIQLTEECDGYHNEKITKEQAIELFKEAIKIIEEL